MAVIRRVTALVLMLLLVAGCTSAAPVTTPIGPSASKACGGFHVVNADEPEGPTVHGNAYCEECADVCDATFPDWTYAMRDDALAAYASPVLREALIQLHRAAVSAGLSAPAVDLAGAALRGIGFDVARGKMTYQR